MSKLLWQTESCGEGRQYMLGHQTAEVTFADSAMILKKIEEGIRPHLFAEPAIRITLDCDVANPERVMLSIPCFSNQDKIIENFAQSIFTSIIGYFASAEPQSSHFGISHSILEGQYNSLLRREVERHFAQIQSRPEMAARVLAGVDIKATVPILDPALNHLSQTLSKGLNIYVGYRIHAFGDLINNAQMFVPMQGGEEIVNLVYSNLEHLISQNFLSYDESSDRYLEVSDTLVFKELGSILRRSRLKENTRKKILNNLEVTTKSSSETKTEAFSDRLYDVLNKVQEVKLKAATVASTQLYSSVMKKAAAMVSLQTAEPSKAVATGVKKKVLEPESDGKTRVQAKAKKNEPKGALKKSSTPKAAEEGLEELQPKG